MHHALDRLRPDLVTQQVFHSGDPVFVEHFGNAYVERRGHLRLVRKEHKQSNRRIDSVVGAVLAYEAMAMALADGWGQPRSKFTRVRGRVAAY
jgi:phage terminase large subunit-like protein